MSGDELSVNECLDLLRGAHVGRLAVVADGRPEIFPVNFAVDHGTVVFRTAEGTKLEAIADERAVAFEADGRDRDDDGAEVAWSVVVKGGASRIRGTELIDTENLGLHPDHLAAKPVFVRIEPDEITGRRFVVADERVWITDQSGIAPSAPE